LRCGIRASRCGTKHTKFSEHFWKLRCGKSAHVCDAKHIRKPIVLKPDGLEPVSEVEKEFEIELKMEIGIQIEIERETEI
jgi:hypothetical protein